MTTYHGGKQRIGKQIAEIIYDESTNIKNEEKFDIKGYCEPFCGMLGVYKHIPDLFLGNKQKLKYKAGDMNKSVILMWQEVQNGWKPPQTCSKKKFDILKYDGKSSAEKGFVGHVCTFRAVYFDSFHQHSKSKVINNVNNVISIGEKIKPVSFSVGSYTQYSNLKNYIIYCDPPYQNVNQRYYEGIGYTNKLVFDSKIFWEWCRMMSENNIVFVSEYKTPPDFDIIYSNGKEKLFVL